MPPLPGPPAGAPAAAGTARRSGAAAMPPLPGPLAGTETGAPGGNRSGPAAMPPLPGPTAGRGTGAPGGNRSGPPAMPPLPGPPAGRGTGAGGNRSGAAAMPPLPGPAGAATAAGMPTPPPVASATQPSAGGAQMPGPGSVGQPGPAANGASSGWALPSRDELVDALSRRVGQPYVESGSLSTVWGDARSRGIVTQEQYDAAIRQFGRDFFASPNNTGGPMP